MTVTVGQWRTGTGVIAHRVATVIPDVTRYASPDPADRALLVQADDCDRWIALCQATIGSDRAGTRTEYVAMFTHQAPWPDTERCSTCEVLSGPFEHWLAEHPTEQTDK